MLVRLVYGSRAVDPIAPDVLESIVERSRANNTRYGVTGMLCAYEQGNGFLQVLEGGRTEVNRLYETIVADERHADVTLLAYEEIDERRFANWRMGRIDFSRVNPAVLLRFSEHPVIDPLTLTASAAMSLIDELACTLQGA